jgi:hypothetical protein
VNFLAIKQYFHSFSTVEKGWRLTASMVSLHSFLLMPGNANGCQNTMKTSWCGSFIHRRRGERIHAVGQLPAACCCCCSCQPGKEGRQQTSLGAQHRAYATA